MRSAVVLVVIGWSGVAHAQRWQDATTPCLGTSAEWTNKVEVADLDGDGLVDIVLANGGNYASPGPNEAVRIFKNLGAGACTEITTQVTGTFTGLSRVAKAIDVDGDGDLDLVTGGAYQSQLRMFTRSPTGWTETSAQLPQQLTSIGDIEAGDVDGDGDLDLLLAEWGATNPGPNYPGGRTRLYLNDGAGTFSDATVQRMPAQLVKWSWDVELVDIDNDWDLDALIACKYCPSSFAYRNDGTGSFAVDPAALPPFANNYDFEPMDITGDGFLDLVTINDGSQLREHIFINNTVGGFVDETATRLAGTANPANADDNAAVWMDVDADGDADLFIATLGVDRLLINSAGVFSLSSNATPNDTNGSLGVAAADLDGDGRLDLVQGQGEIAFADKVQLATTTVAVDTVPPVITVEARMSPDGPFRARVHDLQSPARAHDMQRVWIEHDGVMDDMRWYGEYLWASPALYGITTYRVCARDRRINEACSPPQSAGTPNDDVIPTDAGETPSSTGCCDARGSAPSIVSVVMVIAAVGRRRRRSGRPWPSQRPV